MVCSKNTAIRPKLCGNCAFPQNFYTRKLGEITVFYAVKVIVTWACADISDFKHRVYVSYVFFR